MKKIGFIGTGNMATAIFNGLISKNIVDAHNVYVFDVFSEKAELFAQKGANAVKTADDVVKNADITVLAVKPQNYEEVLLSVKNSTDESKIFVSIAAGISIGYVQQVLGVKCPVVRVMPNTPLLLGKGASALCPSDNMNDEAFEIVKSMFSQSGIAVVLTEDHMNEVISINGSSPAYVYLFAKAMADYATSCGIDYDTAMPLIAQSLIGSAEMIMKSGDNVDTLIDKVCSKGGTTIAAIEKMESLGFSNAIKEGMKACTNRAEEIGK